MEPRLSRRAFLTIGLFMPFAPANSLAAEAEPYSRRYLYEASGQIGNFSLSVPLTLTEKVNRSANTYELQVYGGKGLIFGAHIYSKGIITQGIFTPEVSEVRLSGLIPFILLHQDVAITYNYAASKAYIKRGWSSWDDPLDSDKRLDDLGSAYFNYKYNRLPNGNPFEVWLLVASSKKRGYTKIRVAESVQPNGLILTTMDLGNFLKGIDKNSVTSARLSLEHRLVEEAEMVVLSGPIKVTRIK